MRVEWIWLASAVVITVGFELNDEQYHMMPRLFHLDDYDECLASRRGAFCIGSFDLLVYRNDRLLQLIQQFSEDKYHFNHTHIHRGYCISTRCSHINDASLKSRFEKCVSNLTRAQYGLETNLTRLEYCKTGYKLTTRPLDVADVVFACFVVIVLAMNMIGTTYDIIRNPDEKPKRYLLTWSLIVNWRRLTANYTEGDTRLKALKPVQGMKTLTLILVMLAHSVLAYHLTYVYNPMFFEKASHHVMSAYLQNGTSIVQTFIMVSSFLLAYNLLLLGDNKPGKHLSIKMLPQCLMHRVTRILPVYMFVVGVAATWWPLSGDGPLWAPLVGGESARCRDKWWTQILFINNLVRPDTKCLIHTWFLAVDMQLYVVSAVLTLILGRYPRAALQILAALFLGTVLINFAIVYHWSLKPMVTLMFPEFMRTQFEGEASFKWLYSAPWDSLPSALVGLFVAFIHHKLQQQDFKANQNVCLQILYRLSVPAMFLWVLAGYWMKGVTDPVWVAVYATIDRPVFISMVAFAMFGFFNQIDSLWWQFLSWRGWEILGRMSLSIYLIHWLYALMTLATRSHPSPVSIHEIGGHWLWTILTSFTTAVPLHLLIELPMQKFLQNVVS